MKNKVNIKKYCEKKYCEKEYLKSLETFEKEIIIEEIERSFLEYKKDIIRINQGIMAYSNKESLLAVFSASLISFLINEEVVKTAIFNNNIKEVKDCIKKIIFDSNLTLEANELEEKKVILRERIINEIRRIIFGHYLKKSDQKEILIDKIEFFHLIEISRTNITLFYHYSDEKTIDYANENGFKVFCFQVKITEEKLNIPTHKFNFLWMGNYYEKNEKNKYIDLRLFYQQKNNFVNLKYIENYIYSQTNKDDFVYLLCPNFKNNYRYFLRKREHYFKAALETLNQISKNRQIKLIMPCFSKYSEYKKIESLIKAYLENNHSSVEIGILIDELDVTYEIEDNNEQIDFAVINLDGLDNYNNKTIEYDYFKKELLEKTKDLHDFFKWNKKEHFVLSNRKIDSETIEKMFKMGLKNFIYHPLNKHEAINAIDNYMSRRGKYRLNSNK